MPTPTVAWSETNPGGTDQVAQGDNRIREQKTQFRELFSVDHKMSSSGSGTDWGQHYRCTFIEQANLGTGAVGTTILGNQTENNKGELVYTDEDNNDIVLTRAGKAAIDSAFRSGDFLFTSSSTVPTNFTDRTATYTGKFIRISSSTALDTGGSDSHDHGAVTGSHVLTESEIPAHTHTVGIVNNNDGGNDGIQRANVANNATQATSSYGGGGGHTHTIATANNVPAYVQMKAYQRD